MKRLMRLELTSRAAVTGAEESREVLYLADVPQGEALGSWPMKTCGFSVGTGGSRFWAMMKSHWHMEGKQPQAGSLAMFAGAQSQVTLLCVHVRGSLHVHVLMRKQAPRGSN